MYIFVNETQARVIWKEETIIDGSDHQIAYMHVCEQSLD